LKYLCGNRDLQERFGRKPGRVFVEKIHGFVSISFKETIRKIMGKMILGR